MTQKDYDDRKNRYAAGNATDEDLRLIKQYEREGYEWGGSKSAGSPATTTTSNEPAPSAGRSTVPTTDTPSKKDESQDNDTASSAVKSSGRTAGKS